MNNKLRNNKELKEGEKKKMFSDKKDLKRFKRALEEEL
jgi:hypothetical protein